MTWKNLQTGRNASSPLWYWMKWMWGTSLMKHYIILLFLPPDSYILTASFLLRKAGWKLVNSVILRLFGFYFHLSSLRLSMRETKDKHDERHEAVDVTFISASPTTHINFERQSTVLKFVQGRSQAKCVKHWSFLCAPHSVWRIT